MTSIVAGTHSSMSMSAGEGSLSASRWQQRCPVPVPVANARALQEQVKELNGKVSSDELCLTIILRTAIDLASFRDRLKIAARQYL
mmetsp:Transcript_25036/g.54477  ORF Transcript_25036/g.54477 Transcript_25036/m.54477 type:complete len:86 (+) Transcript_25036:82-339(+)